MRIKGTTAQLEARRRRAARLLGQGKGVNQVARIIGASPSSISRWKTALRKYGPDGLRGKPDRGSAGRRSKARKRPPAARRKKRAVGSNSPGRLRRRKARGRSPRRAR